MSSINIFLMMTAALAAPATTATTVPSYPEVLPEGTNTVCKDNIGMTDELRTKFLDEHNSRRSLLAKGEVTRPNGNHLPQGGDILKLRYDCELEKAAIEEVRKCPTSKKADESFGKNFDTFASSTTTPTYQDAITTAINDWWDVVNSDREGPTTSLKFLQKHVGTAIESFTQMAWASTARLGCAISTCKSNYTVICLYDPKGNIVNQKLYNNNSTTSRALPPCGACPIKIDGCDYSLGLCK
ncbi:unnamed protein product [Cylicocyclus nassatus]|uniref:SCP domain-containing protein n=1 Tax=Cylicocyclus nassatus TaxID=53992 RepID=A0AA36M956_CYLNA|nr:unnamed protein product [Cylicocyclus nassatus]